MDNSLATPSKSQGEDLMQAFATNLATVPATSSAPVRITTTLYDLVEVISAEVGPNEDHLVTAAVMHLINSSRARFIGSRKTLTVVGA
jgi:hypothetical protein